MKCLTTCRWTNSSRLNSKKSLKAFDLDNFCPYIAPLLTPADHAACLEWTRKHKNWVVEWEFVLVGDESRFGLHSDSGRVRGWGRLNERYLQRFMETRAPFRGGSFMVYVGVCVGGRTALYVCRRTMTENIYGNDIADNILPQFQAVIRKNFVYVDDYARPHRTQ
jgi:hypothetical protein